LVQTSLGVLKDAAPVSYQLIGGERVPVESRYKLAGDGGGYGFAVGAYDPRYPLVIDPGLDYSTFLGGTNSDAVGTGIAVRDGNAYVTGGFVSNYPTTPGAFDTSFNGNEDTFVTKLNATGSAPLAYSTFLGGTDTDEGDGIAVREDRAYVTGLTGSANYPTTPGAFDITFNGSGDAFVTKLNASGSALAYSTLLGGTGIDAPSGIAVDRKGSAYVMGSTQSADYPTTPGAFDTTYNGGFVDAFVTKLPIG
jgi:Beta-propeller repeat